MLKDQLLLLLCCCDLIHSIDHERACLCIAHMSFSTLVGNLDVGLLIDQPAPMLGLSSGLLQGLTREEGGVGAHLEGDIGYLLAK